MDFPAGPGMLLLLGVIVVAALAYLSYLQRKRRREELGALARELGWRFVPDRDYSHDQQYAQFEAFRRGHSRCAYNTLTGQIEAGGEVFAVKMGDFRYKVTSGSGKNRRTRTYRFSYLIFSLPVGPIPNLIIRPEGLFDKLAGAFGFDDIDFESAEFSRQYHVTSDDKRFAYDMLHPQMMEFLLETQPPVVDLEHGHCCVSDTRKRWKTPKFRSMLGWWQRFYELWPSHVLRHLQSRV